jgi:hypothetical protein
MPLSALTPAPVRTNTRSEEENVRIYEKCTPAARGESEIPLFNSLGMTLTTGS